MDNQAITGKSDSIELVLLGIDKVWVRAKNGQWRVKKNEVIEHTHSNEDVDLDHTSRKWWKFWKK